MFLKSFLIFWNFKVLKLLFNILFWYSWYSEFSLLCPKFFLFSRGFLYSAVAFFILLWVFFTLAWVFFILPWVFFILSWFSLFCHEFSFFCREVSLFCRGFSLFCRRFLYSAVAFFILSWLFFILLWFSLFCREYSLCCRNFVYADVTLIILPWFCQNYRLFQRKKILLSLAIVWLNMPTGMTCLRN